MHFLIKNYNCIKIENDMQLQIGWLKMTTFFLVKLKTKIWTSGMNHYLGFSSIFECL